MRRALLLASLLAAAGCAVRPLVVAPPERDAPAATTVIRSVFVFDAESGGRRGPVDLFVQERRIAAIVEPGSRPVPAGAEVIEGAGRTLLPGLYDCHVHVGGGDGAPPWAAALPEPKAQLAALLYVGVTSVLTASDDGATDLWAEIQAGTLAGPRLWRAGRPITAEGGHPRPMAEALYGWVGGALVGRGIHEVEDASEARAAVRDELEYRKPDYVKVMYDAIPPEAPHLTPAALRAIADEAAQYGKRMVVHVGSPADAVEAAEAGAALLMHVPWSAPFTQEQLARLAATGVPVVTTASIWRREEEVLLERWVPSALAREVSGAELLRAFATPKGDWRPAGFAEGFSADLPRLHRQLGENVLALRAAGVPLLAGTDSGLPGVLHGPALHEELATLVALGLPPGEVLQMATSRPARLLDPAGATGVVEEGAWADLLLVEGDPTVDIAATTRIVAVFQHGRRLARTPAP